MLKKLLQLVSFVGFHQSAKGLLIKEALSEIFLRGIEAEHNKISLAAADYAFMY